jgi:hypothetical protein
LDEPQDEYLVRSRREKYAAAAALEGRQAPTTNPANQRSLSSIFNTPSIGAPRQEASPPPRLIPQPDPDGLVLDRFQLDGGTLSEASTSAGPSPAPSPTTSATSTPAQSPRQ